MILAALDPLETLKNDPGFLQWLIYLVLALIGWDKVNAALERRKARPVHVTGGSMTVTEGSRPATAADVAAVQADVDELREETQAQFAAQARAGEARVAAIAAAMEKETNQIDHLLEKLSGQVEALTTALHEKINAVALQTSALRAEMDSSKAADFQHTQAIAGLQSLMMQQPQPPRKPR